METDVSQALLKVQKEIPRIQKDSINPHYGNRYISLKALVEAVIPVLNNNGLVLTQFPTGTSQEPVLETVLTVAETAHSISSSMPLLLEKENPQGLGSAITYARRYGLMSILGLVADEDDDGQAASTSSRKTYRKIVKKQGAVSSDTPAESDSSWEF